MVVPGKKAETMVPYTDVAGPQLIVPRGDWHLCAEGSPFQKAVPGIV